jgi:hypothetical protein
MTNRKLDRQRKNKKPDLHFEVKLDLSPRLEEFRATFVEVGKVTIKISRILIPLLLAGSVAFSHGGNHLPQPSLPPDSIEQPK